MLDGLHFENVRESDISLGSFQIENPVSGPLLFQTGYLTIKSYNSDTQLYTLDYPNREVKVSLLDNLLSAYREVFPGTSISVTADLRAAFEQGDTHRIINELNAVIGRYAGDERKKLAIGIEFSSEQRNIADYRVKES